MLNIANHTRIQNVAPLFAFQTLPRISAASFSNELLHRSVIQYVIPRERVRNLVPQEFDLDVTVMLSIESFLNQSRTNFEQTNYRLQVKQNGKPASWLLGTALGSLSGVTARHLYAAPWHLSAMEMQVSYNSILGKYSHYRISSQSQWANSDWEIVDLGLPVASDALAETDDFFVRRDGQIGNYKTMYRTAFATKGQLKTGRCDLLHKLGILQAAEISQPLSVSLQHAVSCGILPSTKAASVLLAA